MLLSYLLFWKMLSKIRKKKEGRNVKVLKKLMAVLVCICMLVPQVGITSYAAETSEITEETTVDETSEMLNEQTDTSEEELAEDSIEQSDKSSEESNENASDNVLNTENNDAEEEKIPEENSTSEEVVEDVSEELQLNYLVIENDYVETPSSQYVVASLGESGAGISKAVLTYTNQTTGTTYTKDADKIQDFLILFDLYFGDSSYAGQYKLVSISYTVNETEYVINLEEEGVSGVFGVDKTVNTSPSAWLVDDTETASSESSDDVPGVIVNDVSGASVSAADVEGALAENGFSDVKIEGNTYYYDEDFNESVVSADPASFVVVLDPGHGGSDTGATRTHNGVTYIERDLNLKIALACKAELEKSGVTVYLTRTDNNTKPSLTERAIIASNYGADLFISIHNNSQAGDTATGSEVWVPNSSSYNYYAYQTGQTLGNDIINQLASLGLNKRGVFTRNATPVGGNPAETYPTGDISDYYTVINESRRRGIPGMIVEHAYVSNPSDAANFLSSDAKLQALGASDAKGILEYIKSAEDSYRYKGVDYGAVYDYDYYVSKNPDIKAAFGNNKAGTLAHFVNNGMSEGRIAKEDFNVSIYKSNYADLRAAFGDDNKQYYIHYINNGKSEGRNAKTLIGGSSSGSDSKSSGSSKNSGKTSTSTTSKTYASAVYNGIDYGAVFDYDYYINKYPDLKAAFGSNKQAALEHFVNNGMYEGRQGRAEFDVNSYRNANIDLKMAFGQDIRAYYLHYINNGINEGRVATGVTEILHPDTVYNGIDYSKVYDFNYYINRYPDLKSAFGNNDVAAIAHFVNSGMNEGRQAIDSFDVTSYRNAYQDLRAAFGNDLKSYYMHYINSGKSEGRKATGVKTLQNPMTVYKGVDYSKVYDYNYYINTYPDIKAAFKGDEKQTLEHFVVCGMKEGRQGKASFNVRYYRANYGDLTVVFGNNLPAYYIHYISDGSREKRVADRLLDASVGSTAIMGDPNTTVAQMAAYYKAKASYPSFYANSDAPTIEAFCQIYYEECRAEGVRADVAFCQAMKETGFLRYGGQVSIEQYNFAGLGATDDGAAGASFGSVREGIRAQVQHLKAYASTDSLKNACVDTRFSYVTRKSAPYVEWLGIQENPNGKGWATAKGYGYSIINDYMAVLRKY